jgi:hypothetical protein
LFILRPVREHHRLVGECYVQGLMQGEAMEQWKAGELQDQWFELRLRLGAIHSSACTNHRYTQGRLFCSKISRACI